MPGGIAPAAGLYPASLQETYVSVLLVENLPHLVEQGYVLTAALRSKGATASATAIETAIVALFDQLESVGVAMAEQGTRLVRQWEVDTRVRPDSGEPAQERMGTHLHCDPITVLPGAVGFINKADIDNSEASWWWTNEIGWSGNVNRELHGYYYDSGFTNRSAPDIQQRRDHPLFRPMGDFGPSMTIKEPIPARQFALKALDELYAEWLGAVNRVLNVFEVRVAEIMAGASAIVYAPIP